MSFLRYWFPRLSFSFLIVGLVLGWEAYQRNEGARGAVSFSGTVLYMAASCLLLLLGFASLRKRHDGQ